ncbi:hypothetical protein LCGC14_0983290 [marine sediment metagenome]|uniref:Uncharacterized protein n=1 Tax=marine sediment metagenome TaxID=412755 RepID=A0A0F9N7W5_9ZZZZ
MAMGEKVISELDAAIVAVLEDGCFDPVDFGGTCEKWVEGFLHNADEGVHHDWGVVWGAYSVQPALVRGLLREYWHAKMAEGGD